MAVLGQQATRLHLIDSESITWEVIGAAYPDPNDPTKLVRDVKAHGMRLQKDDLSAACDGSNAAFTLSQTPLAFLGLVWETTFHVTDFTQVGTAITTAFKDAGGNPTAALAGDKLYALYFY